VTDSQTIRLSGAYHEAAHAVVATCCGWWLNSDGVQIETSGTDYRDYTGLRRYPDDNTLDARMLVNLAGSLAEFKFIGMKQVHTNDKDLVDFIREARSGWGGLDEEDLEGDGVNAVKTLIEEYPERNDEVIFTLFRSFERATIRALNRPLVWQGIRAVAEQLVEVGFLNNDEVGEILMVEGVLKKSEFGGHEIVVGAELGQEGLQMDQG
jgi:hypothetical protein